ncbi:DUF1289 domain-containing protein [Paenirhodobacter populi]|uniref:DUF1289 domain-containing protein n=1 Tax=Paenirhodobacter populi TaxID=2306993 RepID=A0A443JJR0_9RHOB|nr:DUF1289 domain-containing protein [Sinirhodobacter populi]RWR09349.1 DUF1289 domain-containing protein [Sinirhodobacter populi]RWR20750.1 DUF1289 domain-containing protein [Sinirhodobacter populi]RWR34171.1 DUF1289 domain-containing protein [Sinirhodobacter populi]
MAEPIDTPCIGLCRINPRSGLCMGCLRTLDEIARWRDMDPQERRRILRELTYRDPT